MHLRVGLTTVFHSIPSKYFGNGNLFITRSSSIYVYNFNNCNIYIFVMQSFKEISYQNYIELRFNQKNLHQTQQQQALQKYKRNAQLLAEVFSFDKKPRNNYKAEPVITQQHLTQMEKEVEKQKKEGEQRCKQIEQKSKNYCRLLKSIKQIKTQQQRNEIIKQLKQTDLYDEKHPYFAEGSPFFMNSTDEEVLEVVTAVQIPEESTLSLMEIK